MFRTSKPRPRFPLAALSMLPALFLLAGCQRDMADQPKLEPFESNDFFADGQSSLKPVEGTVARDNLQIDDHFYRGRVDGELATTFPAELERYFGDSSASVDDGARDRLTQEATRAMLARGRQRFGIFCAQCHSPIGDGMGMVVRRGFPRPPSYHTDRLREASVGYVFDVITNGFGRMQPHGYLMPAQDRWAIVAYIRALQRSQYASLTEEEFEQLKKRQEDE